MQGHPLQLNSGRIQKAFGVLMIATALSIYLQLDRKFQAYMLEKFPGYGVGLTKFEDNPAVREGLEKLKDTPKQPKKSMLNIFSSDLGSAPEFIPGGKIRLQDSHEQSS